MCTLAQGLTQILLLITQCKLSGGIPILVAALDSSKALAVKAIDMLLSQSNSPNKQFEATETVLVNLQAVPRLCNLLLPNIPGWVGDDEHGKSPCSMLPAALPCPVLAPLLLTHLYDSMMYDVSPCDMC